MTVPAGWSGPRGLPSYSVDSAARVTAWSPVPQFVIRRRDRAESTLAFDPAGDSAFAYTSSVQVSSSARLSSPKFLLLSTRPKPSTEVTSVRVATLLLESGATPRRTEAVVVNAKPCVSQAL